MSESITLNGPTRSIGKLCEQLRWGKSAARPGLADTLVVANHHMGCVLGQLRSLHESRVRELREGNRAAAECPGPARPVEDAT